MEKKIKKIADHYGKEAQFEQCKEELDELKEALDNYKARRLSAEFDNLIEEIADVEIMIEQIRYLCGIGQEVTDQVKEFKLNRQLERIGKGGMIL